MENPSPKPLIVIGENQLSDFPKILKDFAAVVVVADGILFAKSPWNSNSVVRRIAQKLHHQFQDISPQHLAVENGLDFAAQYAAKNPSSQVMIDDLLLNEEKRWSFQTILDPKAGTRQALQEIDSLGKPIHVISTCSESTLQTITDLIAPNLTHLKVHGRTQLLDRVGILKYQWEKVLSYYPSKNVLVMAPAVEYQDLEDIPDSSTTLCFVLIGNGKPSQPMHVHDMVDIARSFPLDSAEAKSMAKAGMQRDRLRELRAQSVFTNEEMAELSLLTGGHKVVGNTSMFGYVSPEIGNENLDRLWRDRKFSLENGNIRDLFTIEANILEGELKNWQIVHHDQSFQANERSTFGSIVARCIDLGFPSELGKRLQRFNRLRNLAIHKLPIGQISYADLESEYLQDFCLVEDTQYYCELSAPVLGHYMYRF